MARIVDGVTDVPTAGTRVRINNTTERVLWLYMRARTANTNNVWFGSVTIAANRGKPIAPGGAWEIDPGRYNASLIFNTLYLDTDTNGNDVEWVALVE